MSVPPPLGTQWGGGSRNGVWGSRKWSGGFKMGAGGGARNGAGPRNGAGVQNGTRGGCPETKQRGGGCSQKRNSREPEVKHGIKRCIDVLLEHKHFISHQFKIRTIRPIIYNLSRFRVFCARKHTVCLNAAKAKDTTVYAKEMRNLMKKVRSTGAIMVMWTLR